MSKFYNIIRYFIDKKSTRVVQASINKYKENIISLLSIELEHIFLWVPVFIGLGIAIYFYTHPFNKEFIESLVEETQCPLMPKSYWIFFIFFITLLLLLAYIFRNRQVVLLLCIVVALILIGYIAAEIRVFWLKAPYIRDKISDVVITGVIEQVEEFENYQRLTLSDIGITDTSIERLPIKIRVNIKTFCDAEIGDHILFNATLMPPPYPVIPGGFNFARFAYFKQIGGIGYATSHVQIIKKREEISSWQHFIGDLRQYFIERIDRNMSTSEGAIARGILLGDATKIEKNIIDDMRIAGTAHIIAISGMHIAVICAILFYIFRLLLNYSELLTLKYNIKKLAAIFAILGSNFYLLLVNAPISGQRAALMSSFVLIGIVLDKRSDAMRCLSLSATLILLLTPEGLMSVSLQMSFAACLFLISSFVYIKKILRHDENKISRKVLHYFITIIASTIVATIATAPFIIQHFHQFSLYSILANLIAIPLSDFFIMPFGLLALITSIFDGITFGLLSLIPFIVLRYAIKLLIYSSSLISTFPAASIYLPSFPEYGFVAIIVSGLLLSLCKTQIRYIGIPFMVFGLWTLSFQKKADILIAENGNIFAIRTESGKLAFSSLNKNRYTKKIWLDNERYKGKPLKINKIKNCTSDLCFYTKNQKTTVIVRNKKYLEDGCGTEDLFVNLTDEAFQCYTAKRNISLGEIGKNSAISIWHNNTGVTVKFS